MDVPATGAGTVQLIVEKLARRIIGWRLPRNSVPTATRTRAPRPAGRPPDEFAGSDGDIVTAAIRSLGLGPVIGARTWAAWSASTATATAWSTAPGSPSRGTRPGSTSPAGRWRITASTPTPRF